MFGLVNGFRKLAAVAVVAAAGFAGASSAAAAEVTVGLDSLLEGGSNSNGIVVGDKRYSNFQFRTNDPTVLTPAQVEVMIIGESSRHELLFLFPDVMAMNGERFDLVFGYDLHVLNPNNRIVRVDAVFDGGPYGPGDRLSAVSMVETVSSLDGSDVAPGGPDQDTEIITLYNDGDEGLFEDTLETALTVNATRGLRFTKDVLISTRPGGGLVGVSVIQQGVDQAVIPLPAAFWAAIPVFGAIMGRKKLAGLLPSKA